MTRSRPRHFRLLAAAALAAGVACILLLVSASARSAPGAVAVSSAASTGALRPDRPRAPAWTSSARASGRAERRPERSSCARTSRSRRRTSCRRRRALLCVWLRSDAASAPEGRLCVAPDARAKSGVGLRYTTLDEAGRRLGIRDLPVVVRRPRATMISASFSPALLRLAPGRYHWQVRSQDGSVEDRLPRRRRGDARRRHLDRSPRRACAASARRRAIRTAAA